MKEELLEKRSNEAVVHLHPITQHTWPQFYACLSSIICPFCMSHHPQVGQLGQWTRSERKLTPICVKKKEDSKLETGWSPSEWVVNTKGIGLKFISLKGVFAWRGSIRKTRKMAHCAPSCYPSQAHSTFSNDSSS
jgi:hypothetical protein